MITDLVGYAAGLCLALCFLPQVIYTLKIKSADDVSFSMLFLSFLSALFYEIYAYLLGLVPVMVMNGIFLALVSCELFLKIYYQNGHIVL